jgi:hypothetical protein
MRFWFALWLELAVIFFIFSFLSFLSAFVPASSGSVFAAADWLVCFLLFLMAAFISLALSLKAAATSS